MFDELRNYSKSLIIIIAIVFVGGTLFLYGGLDLIQGTSGGPRQGEIGRVNGESVQYNTYAGLVNYTLQNLAQQTGQQVDNQTQVLIQNQAWSNIVQETILRQEAERRNISVTNDEIVTAVLNQPPPEYQQLPQFQTNGVFDLAKYQAYLRSPGSPTVQLEQQARASIPLEKLQQQMMATVVIPEQEIWNDYRIKNEKTTIRYIMVPAGNFEVDEASVPQATLQSYYDAHEKEYEAPPTAVVEYVTFSKSYSFADSLSAYETISTYLADHKEAGDDFLQIVADLSEAPLTQRGGENATFISPTQLSPAVRGIASALPVGQVSDIIIEPNGFHVVRVEEKREDETAGTQVKIADLFIGLRPSRETLSTAASEARSFRLEVGKGDLVTTAQEMNYSVGETRPFNERGFIAPFGAAPEIQEFAFKGEVGTVSPPIDRADAWVVIRIKSRTEARIPELAEIEDRVRREAADSLRLDQAEATATALLDRVRSGEDMETAAESDSTVVYDTSDPITRLGFSRGIGNDPTVIGPIFAHDVGLIDEVLVGRRGAFVIEVIEKTEADRAQFDTQKTQLLDTMRQQRQSRFLTAWMGELQADAQVQDFRNGVFN